MSGEMPKKDKPSWYRAVGYILFIAVVVIAVLLFNDVNSFTYFICSRVAPSQHQRAIYDMEILMVFSIIAVAISMYLKVDGAKLFLVFSFLLIFWLVIAYLGALDVPCPPSCVFQTAGIACIEGSINANGMLTLTIGQATGHQIRINGVACTQNTSPDYIQSNSVIYNPPLSTNITVNPGSTAVIANPTSSNGAVANVICTDANGSSVGNRSTSSGYIDGRLYVNYTETDTGRNHISIAVFSSIVYVTPSCWSDPFYCLVSMNNTIFPLLVLVWCALGVYFFFNPNHL